MHILGKPKNFCILAIFLENERVPNDLQNSFSMCSMNQLCFRGLQYVLVRNQLFFHVLTINFKGKQFSGEYKHNSTEPFLIWVVV